MRTAWLFAGFVALAHCPALAEEGAFMPFVSTLSSHNIHYTSLSQPPLFTGNGNLGMSLDLTGSQLLKEDYPPNSVNLISQSIWHNPPLPESLRGLSLSKKAYPHGEGHTVEYPYPSSAKEQELYHFLRKYPNKFNLVTVSLGLAAGGRTLASATEISDISQSLVLAEGVIRSEYLWNGVQSKIETFVHATRDLILFHITDSSPILSTRRLEVRIDNPDAWDPRYEKGPVPNPNIQLADYSLSSFGKSGDQRRFWALRPMPGGFSYGISGAASAPVRDVSASEGRIEIILEPSTARDCFIALALSGGQDIPDPLAVAIQRAADAELAGYEALRAEHHAWWRDFWNRSRVSLNSPDGNGKELERWYQLSLYHLASSCRGRYPPAEGGLVANSWYGKFHLEMHFWHAICFLGANRPDLLLPSLRWYLAALPQARLHAQAMGLRGAKYPKMTSFQGLESPGDTNFRIYWHLGEVASLVWWTFLNTQDLEFLAEFYPVLEANAEFISSFVVWNSGKEVFEILPPVVTCDETTKGGEVLNPAYELAEFRIALDYAIQAARKLGRAEGPVKEWIHVRDHLAPIPHDDDTYLLYEGCPDTWTEDHAFSHPSVLGPFFPTGVVPDNPLIHKTFDRVLQVWDWDGCWGWDFGFAAGAAARLNRAGDAVSVLLKARDKMNPNAVTFSGGKVDSYLPGNGGIVLAVDEMLLQSMDGALRIFRGIPEDWSASFERLRANGAFLVSARLEAGKTQPVTIQSLAGQSCRFEVPSDWGNGGVMVAGAGKPRTLELGPDRCIEFETEAGQEFRLTPSCP
jgi:hypothetical protein